MQPVLDVPEEGQTRPFPGVTHHCYHHHHRHHRHHRRQHHPHLPQISDPARLAAFVALVALALFCLLGPLGVYKSVVEWLDPGYPIAPESALAALEQRTP
jgi:hypothetical protein